MSNGLPGIISSEVLSTGSYLPEKVVPNEELKQFPSRALQLISQKTGVLARRYAAQGEYTSDLAIKAALMSLERAGVASSELDGIILATSSPDRIQPATATRVQDKIGATRAFAFDVNSVCSGGVYALAMGDAFIRSGRYELILVLASEIYSRILNPNDFSTLPYFGDGAGAVLLKKGEKNSGKGILYYALHTDGSGADVIQIPAGGTMQPPWETEKKEDFYFRMNGRAVYDFAILRGTEAILECLSETGYGVEDVACILAHQANENILKEFAARIGCSYEKFFVNLQKYGNTAGASVFIALDEALQCGRIKTGDLVLLIAFGGGLSWGSILMRL